MEEYINYTKLNILLVQFMSKHYNSKRVQNEGVHKLYRNKHSFSSIYASIFSILNRRSATVAVGLSAPEFEILELG